MVERLGVAVLSLTGRNKACADAFFENPRVEIVAVTEDDPPPATSRTTAEQTLEAGRRWALERGVPFADDLEEVLGRSDVQAVTFSSRFERRVSLVEMMADAGKHVFADKPLTATLSDGDAIIRHYWASRREDVRGTQLPHKPGHPERRASRSGGETSACPGRYTKCGSSPPGRRPRPWASSRTTLCFRWTRSYT